MRGKMIRFMNTILFHVQYPTLSMFINMNQMVE